MGEEECGGGAVRGVVCLWGGFGDGLAWLVRWCLLRSLAACRVTEFSVSGCAGGRVQCMQDCAGEIGCKHGKHGTRLDPHGAAFKGKFHTRRSLLVAWGEATTVMGKRGARLR